MKASAALTVCILFGYCQVAHAAPPVGVWRGESLCVTDAPACHNEIVIYRIKAIPGDPASLLIQADKVVDGQPATMFSGPWLYDPGKQTLSWKTKERLWLLKINGKHMEGRLVLENGTLFRRMTLTQD